jgi:hypothetical protein
MERPIYNIPGMMDRTARENATIKSMDYRSAETIHNCGYYT